MNNRAMKNEILSLVLEDTLAKFALMFSEKADKNEVKSGYDDYITVHTSYMNDIKGTVIVSVPFVFCSCLAANVLGIDDDDKTASKNAIDAIKEFVNVVTGQYVFELFGPDKKTILLPPEVIKIKNDGWNKAVEKAQSVFVVDGSPVIARAEIGEPDFH